MDNLAGGRRTNLKDGMLAATRESRVKQWSFEAAVRWRHDLA